MFSSQRARQRLYAGLAGVGGGLFPVRQGQAGKGIDMKSIMMMLVAGAALGVAGVAAAEPYVDYTPQKGVLEVQTVKVDPNHLDDYLAGLKTSLAPGFEIEKKHGIIDWWALDVKVNSRGGDANVMIVRHYPNMAVLEPDKARDQAIEKDEYAAFSKEAEVKAVAGYEKYRTFVSDDFYYAVDFPK
jgi:hypothetical protein